MTSRIDAEVEAYHIARAMSWNYRLQLFEAEALKPILATYDAARAEILAGFEARYASMTDWRAVRDEAVLGEVEAMTAGLRQTLTDQYGTMSATVGSASLAETASALSLGGLVAVNTVSLSPAQFRQFFEAMPICGNLLTDWVNASFSATVQAQIRQALGVGVIGGEGYRPMVKRLEDGLGMARNEATTLARTFVSSANNAARDEVYKANADIVKGWRWLTAGDNLVCLHCLPLHGRKFKMGEGPSLPRHPRCLTADTSVYAPDKIAAFVSTYDGPVFEIGLSDGRRFTVTANHMFLTPNGFAPAKSFRKGDNIFSGSVSNGPVPLAFPNNDGNPSRIDEIVEAFSKTRGVGSSVMPAAAEHLHGDGEFIQGDVNVIAPTSLLRGDFDAFLSEYGDKMPFPFAGELIPSALDRQRLLSLPLFWLRYATDSIVRGNSVLDVIGLRSSSHHQPVGDGAISRFNTGVSYYQANNIARNKERFSNRVFGLAADVSVYNNIFGQGVTFGGLETGGLPIDWRDTVALENGSDTSSGNSKILGEYARRFTGQVTLANVEFVRERYFRWHVYDLQTISSLYYVNGVVSSNCRCVRLPETISWRELGIDIDEFESEADKWIVRGKAGKDGTISVKPIGTGGANPILRISSHPDADSWWASLSAAEKKATQLGPGRAELLDAGKIKMKDLIDNDYKVRTLEQLRAL